MKLFFSHKCSKNYCAQTDSFAEKPVSRGTNSNITKVA